MSDQQHRAPALPTSVMAGLDLAIQAESKSVVASLCLEPTWMAGSSPAMTR